VLELLLTLNEFDLAFLVARLWDSGQYEAIFKTEEETTNSNCMRVVDHCVDFYKKQNKWEVAATWKLAIDASQVASCSLWCLSYR
jgi:hypothetical protein